MKKLIKLVLISAVLSLMALSLGGCRQSGKKNDLTKQKVIVSMGIDLAEDNNYEITVRVYDASMSSSSSDPSNASQSQSNTAVYTLSGETISKAISNLTLQTGNEPMYAQNNIIVIGKSVAEQGLEKIMDFFVRDKKTRLGALFALASEDARSVVKCEFMNDSMPQRELEELISSGYMNAQVKKMNILDVAKRMTESTSQVILPLIEIYDTGIDGQQNARILGLGVFKNNKFTGGLDIEASRGVLFFLDQVENGVIDADADGIKASLAIRKSNTAVRTQLINGEVNYTVRVKMNCDINEIDRDVSKPLDKEETEKIKKAAEENIAKSITQAFEKTAREYNSDCLRLGKRLKITNPDYYRLVENSFDEVMKNSRLNLRVDITISRLGAQGMLSG